ncbi:MAG TPA: EVE domain-containing protein [Roseiflexaceae bacterium]|nr:EVE domain-containing protein [Roseiflexaceae bacterium]
MSYWLLKTEPDCYSFADLQREGATVWDGVANNAALKHMREMAPGDRALIYHTGDERQAVGLAEVASAPYADPKAGDPKLVVVDVRPLRPLARAVSLAEIKAEPEFADFALVRQGRLSVVPVTDEQWQRLLAMAGEMRE